MLIAASIVRLGAIEEGGDGKIAVIALSRREL